jgi:hypothetical protein
MHPGELLKDELEEIDVSLNELARALRTIWNRPTVGSLRDKCCREPQHSGTCPAVASHPQLVAPRPHSLNYPRPDRADLI